MRTIGSNVPDGNDSHSLIVFNREQLLNCFNIVVAYPARAESTVSGCEAKVFHSNAEIDVAMVLVVVCAPVYGLMHELLNLIILTCLQSSINLKG